MENCLTLECANIQQPFKWLVSCGGNMKHHAVVQFKHYDLTRSGTSTVRDFQVRDVMSLCWVGVVKMGTFLGRWFMWAPPPKGVNKRGQYF